MNNTTEKDEMNTALNARVLSAHRIPLKAYISENYKPEEHDFSPEKPAFAGYAAECNASAVFDGALSQPLPQQETSSEPGEQVTAPKCKTSRRSFRKSAGSFLGLHAVHTELQNDEEKTVEDEAEAAPQTNAVFHPLQSAKYNAVFQPLQSALNPSLGESFSAMLMRLTDERGLTDPQVYKAANVSRAAFNSIKNGVTRNPSRQTVVGFAMALELDWEQAKSLMSAAGLAFSDNNLFDVIASYCIKNRIYDVYEANCLMVEYDQPLIGRQ